MATSTSSARRLMVFEQFIRYAGLAVGLKPSARQGEARLRGLHRMMYSKTISRRLASAKLAFAGSTGHAGGLRSGSRGVMVSERFIRYAGPGYGADGL